MMRRGMQRTAGSMALLDAWVESSSASSDNTLLAWVDKELPDWAVDVRRTLSSKRKPSRKAR